LAVSVAVYYYYTCIYNARKFSNDTESEATQQAKYTNVKGIHAATAQQQRPRLSTASRRQNDIPSHPHFALTISGNIPKLFQRQQLVLGHDTESASPNTHSFPSPL